MQTLQNKQKVLLVSSRKLTMLVFGILLYSSLTSVETATFGSREIINDASVVQNINEIVDKIIPDMAENLKKCDLDPLDVKNLRSRELSHCKVEGLSKLYRSRDCYFTSPNKRNGFLQAFIGFHGIIGTCDFTKKILFYNHRGKIQMYIPNMTMLIHISQKMESTARPVLEFLDVSVPRRMTLEAHGDDTANLVLDAIQIFYRRRMRRVVEDALREKIQEILLNYLSKITLDDINKAIIEDNYNLLLFNNTEAID